MKKYSPPQWSQTPYAKTKAGDPDQALTALLEKYGVTVHQISQVVWSHGRPAIVLRFMLRQSAFRIGLEILDAPDVDLKARVKQVKRAIYWMLKTRLEESAVFGTPEELMCGWLELADGRTIFEASEPHIARLSAPEYATKVFGLLPPAKD